MKLIVGFILLFFLGACSDFNRPKQLDKIELLETQLKELKVVFDSDSMELIVQEINKIESRLQMYFETDTLQLELIKKLDSYKRVKPALMFVLENENRIIDTRNQRLESLSKLRFDIENGVGLRDKYNENIRFEEEEMNKYCVFVNYCDSTTTYSFKTFNTLQNDVRSFSLRLEEKYKVQ